MLGEAIDMKGVGLHTGLRQDAWVPTAQDLESLDRRLYQVKEEELIARTAFPLKTDDDPGAEVLTYDMMTRRGAAKIWANGADDIPLVEVDIRRQSVRVYSIVTGYSITDQDIRHARYTGRPIDGLRADAARKAVAEKENRIVFHGDEGYGIVGVLNWPGIQVDTVAEATEGNGDTEWSGKTGFQIIADLREARKKGNTLPGIEIDTLILPPAQYEELEKPVTEATNDTRTVRRYLQEVGWFRRILKSKDLEGAGSDGSDCFLMYDSDRENVEVAIPMDMQRDEPVRQPKKWLVSVEERIAGAIIRFPQGFVRGDGI